MALKFVIGDIHGCFRTLKELIASLGPTKDDDIYLLGDLMDRGPDSMGVVQFLLDLKQKGYRIHPLRGNHEQLLLDSSESMESFEVWMRNGGRNTLKSYDCQTVSEMDQKHLSFIGAFPFYLKVDNFWLVHAGFNGQLEDPLKDQHSMLWIRNFEVNSEWLQSGVIIHGHTPTRLEVIKRTVNFPESQVICLDGGCVFNYLEGMGHLVGLELTQWKLFSQYCLDQTDF